MQNQTNPQNVQQGVQPNVQQNGQQNNQLNAVRQTAGQQNNVPQNQQTLGQNQQQQQQPLNQTLTGQNQQQQQPLNQTLTRQNQQQQQQQLNQTLTRQNQPQQLNQAQQPQPLNQTLTRQNQLQNPQQPQLNQNLTRQNQLTQQQQPIPNQQNNANKALVSRQSKLSAANIQATNELPQPTIIQQQPTQRPVVGPQHNLQSRQSKLSIGGAQPQRQVQQPVVISQTPVRPNGSRQSKLSIVGNRDRAAAQGLTNRRAGSRQSKLSIMDQEPNRNRAPVQGPTNRRMGSRQSKLSVIDAEQRPRQNVRRQSQVSNKSAPGRRRVQSPPNRDIAPNFQTRNRRLSPTMSNGRINTAVTNVSTYSQYETLEYETLVIGHENPEIFTEGLQNEGWMSDPDAHYPIDVILGLEHIANVYKIYISVIDHLTPSKIEVSVGHKRKEDEEPTYETARSASFERKATMRFEKRSTDVEEKESKVAFIDAECQYIWILVHAPHPSRLNPTNQVRITDLTIEGYSIEPKHHRTTRSRQRTARSMDDSFRYSVTPPRTRQRSRRRIQSRASTAFSNVSKISDVPTQIESRNGRVSRISSILEGGLSEGDGWKSNGDNLATDPLMAVRLVRNLLSKKQKRALKRGRDVEATVCLRAVETLGGYERQMLEIRKKMSEAIQQGNTDEARKQELSLIDCRDTAFRVIHLDLLLEQTELRAIGVQSRYADPTDLR